MSINVKADTNQSPGVIYQNVMSFVNNEIESTKERENFEAVIDMRWFFLHSKYHKRYFSYKKHIGKWKDCAASYEVLISRVYKVIPLVGQGKLPAVKFTNLGNVFSGERMMVAYCFPFGPSSEEAKNLLVNSIGDDVVWGSEKCKEPGLNLKQTRLSD